MKRPSKIMFRKANVICPSCNSYRAELVTFTVLAFSVGSLVCDSLRFATAGVITDIFHIKKTF